MRITARQLRQIIKEEVENMMSEEDAAVTSDSLKAESNFSVNYTFTSDGTAYAFHTDSGFRDVKTGKLQFRVFKNNTGELRAAARGFVSDTGKSLAFSVGANEYVKSMSRPPVTARGILAPAGATVGQVIEIPVNVTVRLLDKSVDFKFTAI